MMMIKLQILYFQPQLRPWNSSLPNRKRLPLKLGEIEDLIDLWSDITCLDETKRIYHIIQTGMLYLNVCLYLDILDMYFDSILLYWNQQVVSIYFDLPNTDDPPHISGFQIAAMACGIVREGGRCGAELCSIDGPHHGWAGGCVQCGQYCAGSVLSEPYRLHSRYDLPAGADALVGYHLPHEDLRLHCARWPASDHIPGM